MSTVAIFEWVESLSHRVLFDFAFAYGVLRTVGSEFGLPAPGISQQSFLGDSGMTVRWSFSNAQSAQGMLTGNWKSCSVMSPVIVIPFHSISPSGPYQTQPTQPNFSMSWCHVLTCPCPDKNDQFRTLAAFAKRLPPSFGKCDRTCAEAVQTLMTYIADWRVECFGVSVCCLVDSRQFDSIYLS